MITVIRQPGRFQRSIWAASLLVIGFLLYQPPKALAQWMPNDVHIYNTNSGNVGIGTMTPNATLEINRSQNAGTTTIVDNGFTTAGNGAYSGIFLKQAGTFRFIIDSINDNNTAQVGGPGAVQLWNFVNGPMLFATNNAEAMRITAAGKVGIGTTSPGANLDIQSGNSGFVSLLNIKSTDTSGSNGAARLIIGHQNSSLIVNAYSSGAPTNLQNSVGFFANGSSTNKLVIGHTGTTTGNDVQFFTNNSFGSPQMVLTQTGNVGIGTTSPSSTLHVVGDLTLTGTGNISASG